MPALGYVPQPAQPGQPKFPAGPSGRGVALLAPLTGPNAERGQALVNAAKLALADPGGPPLDVRDTAGTPEGAAAAASAALAAGAGLIIGPLTSAETAAVAPVARPAGIAVLAFTNDPAQAQPGVWTLGITPVQQVRRLVGAAAARNKGRFAAALPSTPFGQSMATALTQAVSAAGGPSPDIRFYESSNAGISNTIRDLADYASRRGPLEARRKAALAQHTAEGRREAANLSRESVPPPPFESLLLAETGEKLAWLSSFLGFYDIDSPTVQVMGPALWAAPSARAGAELNGAWYAAPTRPRAAASKAPTRRNTVPRRRAWPISPTTPRRLHGCWPVKADSPSPGCAGRRDSAASTGCSCCRPTARCGAGSPCSRSTAAARG